MLKLLLAETLPYKKLIWPAARVRTSPSTTLCRLVLEGRTR